MPESAPPRTPDSRRDLLRDAAVLVLAVALVGVPRLWAKSLWSPDEARYAEVTREMRATGDFLVPRVYGEPETSYPPLYYWLISLFSLPAGRVSALGATLPSLAAAAGVSLLTYAIGRTLWDRRAGLASALLLTSMAGFVGPAVLCRADMSLALFELSALFLFLRWYRNPDAGPFPLLFGVALAAGTLAKGPQAVVVVAGVVLGFLACRRELGRLRQMRILPVLALLVALTVPWYAWARLKTGQDYLIGESLSGFAGTLVPGGHGRRSMLIYPGVIFARAFPWILFLPAALIALRREETGGSPDRDRGGAFAFLVSWILVVGVFYSLAASKRHYYVTAVYPPLALAVGRFWGLAFEGRGGGTRALVWPLGVLALLAVGSELWMDLGPGRIGSFAMAPFAGGLRALHAVALAVAVAGLVLAVRRKREVAILALLAGLVVAGQAGSMATYEIPHAVGEQASGRWFVENLRAAVPPGERLYLFREDVPSVPLHLDRECRILRDAGDVRARVNAGEAFAVGVKEWRVPEIRAILPTAKVAFRETIPDGGAVLLFFRPGR